MSNLVAGENATQEKLGFSLTEAVEDVSRLGFVQTEGLKEKQKTLSSLQCCMEWAGDMVLSKLHIISENVSHPLHDVLLKHRSSFSAILSDVEKKGEMVAQVLRSNMREILILEGKMEHLEQQTKVLSDRWTSIRKENTELQIGISEEEENARKALARFNTYRNKMEGHRAAVLRASSQTKAHKELEEKRALVKMLTQKKEELKKDLENPNGNTVQLAKGEIDALKGEISVMEKTTAERREQLRKEFETHTQIKKDIEIQNRRYEAIVKRLHCQLSRAQAFRRQISEDIYHMERQLAELKRQLESSQDSPVSGQ